jgi:hypothetical protein
MRQALRSYSHVLQLRSEAIRGHLDSFDAAYALKLLIVVGLIAGLGVLLGIPNALRQLTLPEQIDQAVSAARTTTAEIAAVVMPAIANAESATQAVVAIVQEQVAGVSEQINSVVAGVTAGLNAGREQVAQVQQNPQVQQLQVQAGAAVGSAMAQLQPMLAQMSISEEQFNRILAQLSTTPEQFNRILQQLSLAPEAVGQLVKQIEATPEQLEKFAADLRTEAVKAEPPIGTRASRVVHLFGYWLSVPLHIASDWLLFALMLLVVTKLLGGRAPLPKHLAAMALAAAPLVLLFGTYIPDMTGVLSAPMATAIHYYGRILAITGLAWAGLILLRTISLAHEISMWRTAGAMALTWAVLHVLVPLAGVFLTGYLLA